jgi:ABC-type transporter Mla MlaB component
MLRITTRVTVAGVLVFELEGKLAGLWVKELKALWRSTAVVTQGISPARVDLSSVTFIDEEGKTLLREMYREGAELVTTGCLNKCIVESIMRSGSPEERKA